MPSEQDYLDAREKAPEPAWYPMERYSFAVMPDIRPTFMQSDFYFAPETAVYERGYFEKRLLHQGGASFWAWVGPDDRVYY